MFVKRCVYHGVLGILVSFLWFGLGFAHWDLDTIPTTDFWLGLMLILLFQTCRVARYMQKNLGEKPPLGEQFGVWWRLASPYFLESFPSLLVTLMYAHIGGSETLCFRPCGAQSVASVLLLAGILIFLCPLCGSVLGWKLSESRMPVFLPIVAAVYLNLLAVPFTFGLHSLIEQETFPLLHVLWVTVTAQLFLLYCCRSKPNWFDARKPPHSTFLVACLLPAVLPALLIAEHVAFALFVFLLTVLACGPVYLLSWIVPWRPADAVPRALGCFICGALSGLNLFVTGALLLTMEEPSCGFTFDRFPIFVFVGVLSASAVLFERKA